MNAEAKRLLDAILAEPDRDEPRLVYADWLLASGDRLGELIVAQIEHARDPGNPELGRRADALISALRAEVIGDLPLSEPVFRRGFVEAAQLDARAFVELGVRLFDRLPLLTGLVVWFEGLSANREVCKSPVIRRLRELGLRYADGVDVDALSLNPGLKQLRRLELTGCELGPPGCLSLSSIPPLASLHTLEIGSDQVGAAGMKSLSLGNFADNLRSLRLWKTQLGPGALRYVRRFPKLEALDLGFNDLDAGTLEPLSALSKTLRSLGLRGNRLDTRAIGALAPLTLTDLDLDGARLGDPGVSALAELDLSKLETLDLSGNALTLAGVRAVLELPMPKLRRLVLRRNEFMPSAKPFARKLVQTRVELDAMVLLPGRA